MRYTRAIACLGLGLAASVVLCGEEGVKHPVAVSKTERFSFAREGTIRMIDGYGHLNVQGWDEPAVEITVTKSMGPDYRPEQEEWVKKRLERVHVAAEQRSETDLVLSTGISPGGRHFHLLPNKKTGGVLVDYDIHVPRNSRLVIHHGKGYVSVSDVAGDIEATASSGDILVVLPLPGSYSIDAKCGIGKVVSDFAGIAHRRYLLGERFDQANRQEAHRIRLRVGFGGITIQELPREEFRVSGR